MFKSTYTLVYCYPVHPRGLNSGLVVMHRRVRCDWCSSAKLSSNSTLIRWHNNICEIIRNTLNSVIAVLSEPLWLVANTIGKVNWSCGCSLISSVSISSRSISSASSIASSNGTNSSKSKSSVAALTALARGPDCLLAAAISLALRQIRLILIGW